MFDASRTDTMRHSVYVDNLGVISPDCALVQRTLAEMETEFGNNLPPIWFWLYRWADPTIQEFGQRFAGTAALVDVHEALTHGFDVAHSPVAAL